MSMPKFGSGVLLLTLAGTMRAEPPLPLDLIPENACIGIAVRDPAALRVKGDKLVEKLPRQDFPERPSRILDQAVQYLALPWKIDDKKSAAIVCMTGELAGFDAKVDPNKDYTIGTVLAPQSLEEVAKEYKLKLDDLKKGQVRMVPGKRLDRNFDTNQLGYQNGRVYLTGVAKCTEAWMKARTVRQGQTEARAKRLDSADAVLYFGPPVLALGQKDVKPEDIGLDLLAGEAEAQRRLVQGWLEARHILAGIRVDGGFGLDLGLGFDPKGVHSQKLCKAFSGRTSNLAGLPDSDRLVGAFSTIGLERTDLHLARVLASDLWRGVRSNTAFLGTDSELIRRLFADFYSRLKVGKAAVYQSSDPARFGQIGAVLILEPTNSGQFITEVMQYVRLGDVAQFDPKGQASKVEIDKLVADLGADDFETRESASTKIGLIGSDALPYLVKADKSDDPEVRRRAAELRKSIEDGAAQRKKELAEGLVGRQSSFDG